MDAHERAEGGGIAALGAREEVRLVGRPGHCCELLRRPADSGSHALLTISALPLFCRHNRLEANCPICSKEAAARRPATPARPASRRSTASVPARRHGSGHRAGTMVTKRLARAGDDGYRNDLVPGVRATADAERLAACLAAAAERLEFPGPYPEIAEAANPEDAIWLAFLLALAGPDRPELQEAIAAAAPGWDAVSGETGLPAQQDKTVAAYRNWVERAGTQVAAIGGDASWTPERRFQRVFDRLALPGFARGQRFEFLTALGAAGVLELQADALHVAVAHDDATTLAAKRALNSGDAMLLERRAAHLAEGTGVPVAALDRALALWDGTGDVEAPDDERHHAIRHALRVE